MQLTFEHAECAPQDSLGEGTGCPIQGREIKVSPSASSWSSAEGGRLNEYIVPDIRCLHTNTKLKLVAVDGNRNL